MTEQHPPQRQTAKVDPVARLIRRRRLAAGLSARDVALRLGVSPAFITLIETGKKRPGSLNARALARVLALPEGLLLAWVSTLSTSDMVVQRASWRVLRQHMERVAPDLWAQMTGEVEAAAGAAETAEAPWSVEPVGSPARPGAVPSAGPAARRIEAALRAARAGASPRFATKSAVRELGTATMAAGSGIGPGGPLHPDEEAWFEANLERIRDHLREHPELAEWLVREAARHDPGLLLRWAGEAGSSPLSVTSKALLPRLGSDPVRAEETLNRLLAALGRGLKSVPVVPEGTELEPGGLSPTGETVWVDPGLVPDAGPHTPLYAWRLSAAAARHAPDRLAAGDLVVLREPRWPPRADEIAAARVGERLELCRVALKGDRLVLLLAAGEPGVEIVPVPDPARAPAALRARVALVIRGGPGP